MNEAKLGHLVPREREPVRRCCMDEKAGEQSQLSSRASPGGATRTLSGACRSAERCLRHGRW